MNWSDFSIGFWHPLGSHASEPRDSILARKAREIQDNGWTLWSFQHRKTLDLWRNLIQTHNPSRVYVLCSDSPGALDPRGQVGFCRSFRLHDKEWEMIPPSISVPHPFGSNMHASAFRVKNVMKSSSLHDTPSFTIERTRLRMQIGEEICCQQEVNTSFAEGVGEKYEEFTPFLNLNIRTLLICGDKRIFMENGLTTACS